MNRGRRGGGGGRDRNTHYSPRGRTSPDSSSSQPHTSGGTDGSFNSVPTEGNSVSSQFGRRTWGQMTRGNSCNLQGGTDGSFNSVPTEGNSVSSQFGRRTWGQMTRGNSKHYGHTPSSDHSYRKEHNFQSLTRKHQLTPNSPQGLDHSSNLPHTFSTPNSGFNDFPPLLVQSDSGDKHPSDVKSQRCGPVVMAVEINNVSLVDTEFSPSKSTVLSQSGINNERSDKEKQVAQSSYEKTASNRRPVYSGCENLPSSSAQSDTGHKHLSVVNDQMGKPLDTLVELKDISLCDTDFTSSKSSTLRIKKEPSEKDKLSGQNFHEKAGSIGRPENSDCMSFEKSFDICPGKSGNHAKLNPPLHLRNREKRNEAKRSMEGRDIQVLRPGMILLKSYISSSDQANIVKICWKLGLGSGGFYQPHYHDGAEIHLKMMCLGMDWDPNTGKYRNQRSIDGAKPPVIPDEFQQLVKAVIEESHVHLQKQPSTSKNVEATLPWMSPNICIVNFYSKNGRLGLHQDKDESVGSLDRGLPVVSFSVGDSAEFLYGDDRDPLKADKVILQSGDVLLFGGKSRLVFHGVTNILSDTAPKTLLEATNFRSPGRLNLTFREN